MERQQWLEGILKGNVLSQTMCLYIYVHAVKPQFCGCKMIDRALNDR